MFSFLWKWFRRWSHSLGKWKERIFIKLPPHGSRRHFKKLACNASHVVSSLGQSTAFIPSTCNIKQNKIDSFYQVKRLLICLILIGLQFQFWQMLFRIKFLNTYMYKNLGDKELITNVIVFILPSRISWQRLLGW
jgi:hypothetical protein